MILCLNRREKEGRVGLGLGLKFNLFPPCFPVSVCPSVPVRVCVFPLSVTLSVSVCVSVLSEKT